MSSNAERSRIAVVEHEACISRRVSDMLSWAAVEVEIFPLGTSLLTSANLLHFKAIILDLSLPDLDGFDLMDRLASCALGISVVLMSGHEPIVLRAAHTYGNAVGLQMRGTLAKPFTRDQLLDVLGLPYAGMACIGEGAQ
jgi:FixJ family two-component response regulator